MKICLSSGEVVGEVKRDIYVTRRSEKYHYFRKFQGYGISQEVLDKLPPNVKTVLFVIRGDHSLTRFATTIEDIRNKAVEWFDKGDRQLIMPLEEMRQLQPLEIP